MNVDLLENAVKYHGKKLFDMILLQNNCAPSETANNDDDSTVQRTNNEDRKSNL